MKTLSHPITSSKQRRLSGSAIEVITKISLTLLFAATAITGSAQTTITSIPFTITKSDTYILDKNFATSSTGAAITVAASDVVIDLGGHTLKQKATTAAGEGILVNATENNVTVENGTVSGFIHGLEFDGSQQILIQNLHLSNCQILIDVQNSFAGLIQNSSFFGAQFGVYLNTCTGIQVKNNQIQDGNWGGYSQGGNGNAFTGNYLDGLDNGLFLGSGDKYQDNVVTDCGTPFTGGTAVGTNNG
jgi:hypothetical protein